jgi:hypothetical protein
MSANQEGFVSLIGEFEKHVFIIMNGFQATSSWISWLFFVDKCQLVNIVHLEMTFMKCNQHVKNPKENVMSQFN